MTDMAMSCLPLVYSSSEHEIQALLQEFSSSQKAAVLQVIVTAYSGIDVTKAEECAAKLIRKTFISAAKEVSHEPASSQAVLMGGCVAGGAALAWQLIDHSGQSMHSLVQLMGYLISGVCIAGGVWEMLAVRSDKENEPANDSIYMTPKRRDNILKIAKSNLANEMKKLGCLNFGS